VVLDSALEDCREALRLDPSSKAATDSLAMALLKAGRLKEALSSYDKAIADDSGADAYMGRAIVRERLGDKAGAEADAVQARKLSPTIDDTFAGFGLKVDESAAAAQAAATTAAVN
jgi:Flp pilus assembly protein TadD